VPKKAELVPAVIGFNYDLLEANVAEQVRSSADRIREKVKKTVKDIIEPLLVGFVVRNAQGES
jgi:hypothetical protein